MVKTKQSMKINHIAMVVEDLDQALSFWQDVLGIDSSHRETVDSQNSEIAFFPLGDCEIELVKPTDTNSGMARYLQNRGPGVHHICLEVEDLEMVLHDLKSKNVRLINESPVELSNRKIAFIHPKSTQGVLIELYQALKN